ncbi:hypothetical protein [Natranaerobius trueperi]|uniref:Uncharacterized protein n=1 Tax=Natranaerobius trueperi TaxID=759412 RepID=A0A226BVJ6_9FIRM|nr:hypothetical protein [Natranaerobius trueperi]OWZ83013.1 hypothetical protein CDO51_10965 [Natranaerobius trueperi]
MHKGDIILTGALAGFIGNIVKLLTAFLMYYTGIINKTYLHIASKYYQHDSLDNIFAILNSLVADFFYAATLGVIFFIILKNTNMYYAKLKGLLFGGLLHILNNGVLIFDGFNDVVLDEATEFFLLFPTLIFGFVTCWIIKKRSLN